MPECLETGFVLGYFFLRFGKFEMAFSELPLLHCHSHNILAKPVCSLKKNNKLNKINLLLSLQRVTFTLIRLQKV